MIASETPCPPKQTCLESTGNAVDSSISSFFYRIGFFCCNRPKLIIGLALGISIVCAGGMAKLNSENRGEKLWVPQGTVAGMEQEQFLEYFPAKSRFQNVIISTGETSENVLTKEHLVNVMKLHESIEMGVSKYDGKEYTFTDLCTVAGGSCATYDVNNPICNCLVISILKMWNYDLPTLEADPDFLSTLNNYGSKEDLSGVLGNPVFDSNDNLILAEAISISYFLEGRSFVENGSEIDPINEEWEASVYLKSVQNAETEYSNINAEYISSRSFDDEFGGEIGGDFVYVQVSYIVSFVFLGAAMGSRLCGRGSRWTMSFSALVLVALSTVAGFGVASLAGLLYGPVHSVLPFVLLGIGVDDAFVIANAFDQERKGVPRDLEDDESMVKRGARALARSGASISVTSLTDLVAFAISSSSVLPALASFCAFASINIFFLWVLSVTFFTSTMLLDEKRQRDNRRDMLCCLTRKSIADQEDDGSKEGRISRYFRNYHGPAILSRTGKPLTVLVFSALLGFGIYGTMELPVEDSSRNFIPEDSYIKDYAAVADLYFPSSGTSLYITFENGEDIYASRQELAELKSRVSGLSQQSPYIAEPDSDSTYQNVMAGLKSYLDTYGSVLQYSNVTFGDDGWPANYNDFVAILSSYVNIFGPGAAYAQDVSFSSGTTDLKAIQIKLEYVRLTKLHRNEIIDDAKRQIESMDDTRAMVSSWTDLPSAFPYCAKFIDIEGFKIINTELYRNVGLAILAVGLICLITVANFVTAFLIMINVAACIVEILGFMYALGLVIDSVSVINLVLAVGLSVDYSAHIGHCFMVKGGNSRDQRAIEALADIGASVLNGALSTFLAVAILLFSSSYVFRVLSTQFALTVALGVLHGTVLLPVLLSFFGPKPFASAEEPKGIEAESEMPKREKLDKTAHAESFGLDALELAEDEEEHDA